MLRIIIKEAQFGSHFVWEIHQSCADGSWKKTQQSHTNSFATVELAKENAMTQIEYQIKTKKRLAEIEASAVSFDIEFDELPAPAIRSGVDDLTDAIRAIVQEVVQELT